MSLPSSLSSSKLLLLLIVSLGSIVPLSSAFQQPLQQIQSLVGCPTPLLHQQGSALNVKFRIDNDDDEEEEEDYNNVMISNDNDDSSMNSVITPSTTFGAEAVPESQRPANEYMELLSSPLFGWANRPDNPDNALLTRLGLLYIVSFFLVCLPISGATFTSSGYEIHQFFSSNVGAIGFVLAIVLRLYTGWAYVGSRLQSKQIEYEETGWYDGDIEYKTDAEIARDLFLFRESVQPVIQRLQKFAIIIGSLWIASCIGLNVAFNAKPMFNEYDPEMLKMLNYDDKVAGVAAEQSNGRPTYCDSRYYRAVANGGQGC